MAIETIILQAETLNLVGTDSLARTRTANQEKDGVNGLGADVPGPNDQNTGSPNFDDYGLRPNYGGDGYVDINGGAGDKITFQVNDGGDLAVPAGSYDLTLRAASSSNRAVKIVVDGIDQGAPQTVNTGEFYLWDTYTFAIDVPATPGPHTVVIEQTTSAGPNVDAIAISDVGATVEFPVTPLLPPAPEPVIEQILLQGEAADIPPGATTFHRDQIDIANGDTDEQEGAPGSDKDGLPLDAFGLRPGYTGTGYTDFNGDGADLATGDEQIAWDVTVTEAGRYELHVRYAAPPAARPLDLYVGTDLQAAAEPFGSNGFNGWTVKTLTVDLEAGGNTIALAVPAGFNNGPNVDAAVLTSVGAAPSFAAPAFASDAAVAIEEGDTAVLTVEAADVDDDLTDGQDPAAPTYALVGGADQGAFTIDAATGALSLSAPADFEARASYEVIVEATDAQGDAATQTITVTVNDDPSDNAPDNTAPTALPGTADAVEDTATTIDVADLAADAEDGDEALAVEASVDAQEGSVSVSGTVITFTPAPDFSGEATVAYTVTDTGGLPASSTIAVSVAAVDDPAVVTLAAVPAAENVAGATVATISVSDPDDTYGAADFTAPEGFQVALRDGALVLALAPEATLDFEADAAPQVTVSLGGVSASTTLAVTNDPADDAPEPVRVGFDAATVTAYSTQDRPGQGGEGVSVGDDGASLTLDGNLWKRAPLAQSYEITAATRIALELEIGTVPEIVAVGFDANDNHFDSGGVRFHLAGTQSNGTFTDLRGTGVDVGGGRLRFEIDLGDYAGTTIDSLVFVSDDDLGRDGLGRSTFFDVTLSEGDAPGNTPPRVLGSGVADLAVPEGGDVEIILPFVDDDGDALSYAVEVRDEGGALVDGALGLSVVDGVLVGDVPELPGLYTVTLRAGDAEATVSTAFALTVEAVNDAPVGSDPALEPYTARAGQAIAGIDLASFAEFFTDPDGDALTLSVEDLPQGLSLDPEGVIVGTPTAAGTVTAKVRATDPEGASDTIDIVFLVGGLDAGDQFVLEAERLTIESGARLEGIASASGDQVLRAGSAGQASAASTVLSAAGLAEGFYQVSITYYDETDGNASFSLSVGDTTLLDDEVLDDRPGGFDDPSAARGNAAQAGNLRTVSFDEVVFVDEATVLRWGGLRDAELLRTDKFTFTRVEAPNEGPEQVALDASPVAENDAGAVVGDLSAVDPDGDDAGITFATDASSPFEVVDGVLKLRDGASLDFEAGATASVAVTATDADGAQTIANLTVSVTDVDEAPGAPALAANAVAENAAGAVIGTLTAIDPEGGTVTIASADPRFVVEGDVLRLADGVSLDFEVDGPDVDVDLTVSDGENDGTGTVTFALGDANDAPTLADGASLDAASVAFGAGGTIDLSGLGASDEDAGDVASYDLASAGDPLPAGFAVDGDTLVVPDTAPAGTYEIDVFATDGEAQSESVRLSLTVGEPAPFEPFVVEVEDDDATDGRSTALDLAVDDATVTQIRVNTDPETAERDGPEPGFDEFGLREGYSGTGYADYGDDAGDALVFSFNVPTAGDYDLNVRYASNSTRPLALTVNEAALPNLAMAGTDPDGQGGVEGFSNWAFETVTVTLLAGANEVRLAIPAGANTGPNVDRIEITEAGTGPIPEPDLTADEGDDLAATAPATVQAGDLDAVEIRLAGVDDDITGFEVSLDNGETFQPQAFAVDGTDRVATLDLSGEAGSESVEVQVRVSDGANTKIVSTTFAVDDTPGPFAFELQLEDRTPGVVTIIDDTGGGEGDPDSTQVRDPANPEDPGTPRRGADNLWDNFTGDGYLDMGGDEGDAFSFDVTVPADGQYVVSFRYAMASGNDDSRPMTLTAGDAVLTLPFDRTPDWDVWEEEAVTVALEEGVNTLTLANTIANGPNLDRVTITPAPVGPAEAERLDTVIAINFEPEVGGQFGAPQGYETPAGFEADTGEAYAARGNGFDYGWLDVEGTAITAPQAQPSGSMRYKNDVPEASDLQKTYAHFEFPGGAGKAANERAWEIALEDGTYEVTASIGDTGGQFDSTYVLNAEGEQLNQTFVPQALDGSSPTGGAYNQAVSAGVIEEGEGFRSDLVTGIVTVADGRLTLDSLGGDNTEIQWLEIREVEDLTPSDDRPAEADYAGFSDAVAVAGVGDNRLEVALEMGPDGTPPTGVDPASDLTLGLDLVSQRGEGDLGRAGISFGSLADGSIRLFDTLTGEEVATSNNTSGGNDTLTISPEGSLAENRSYTLVIDGALDIGENDDSGVQREFQTFTTTFVTGESREVPASEVAFAETIELNGAADGLFGVGSITLSPDGAFLYATTLGGTIERFRVDAADGSIVDGSRETINLTNDGDYFQAPEAASLGFPTGRAIIGIAFDPDDENTIWVTDNYPVPLSGRNSGVPDFSARLTKIALDGTTGTTDVVIDEQGNTAPVPAFNASAQAYVTGLTRSNGDHLTNSIAFKANPDFDATDPSSGPSQYIYLSQGANTAIGGADPGWGTRPERLLSAGVLEIDPTRDVSQGPIDITSEPLPSNDENRRFTPSGQNNPRDFDEVTDNYTAVIDGETVYLGRVQIPAGEFTGADAVLNGQWLHWDERGVATVRETDDRTSAVVREYYDPFADDAAVKIYATGVRNAYDIVAHSNGEIYLPSNGTAAGGITPDDPSTDADERITNVSKQDDYLFVVQEGGYYGSPNPVRDEYIAFAGNPTAGRTPGSLETEPEGNRNGYPAGQQPDPNFDGDNSYSLDENRSPNGSIEYTSNAFGASLQGFLLVTEYSQGDDIIAIPIGPDGTPDVGARFALQDPGGNKLSWTDPLDIAEGANGVIYVSTLDRDTGQSQIIRLDPAPGGTVVDDTADEGGNLTLTVLDAADAGAVEFLVTGDDADIEAFSLAVGGGDPIIVTPDANGRFVVDLSAVSGEQTATLTVSDGTNTANSPGVSVTPGSQQEGLSFDATAFTVIAELEPDTVIRRIDDASTYEPTGGNDADGDGLNDNYDGLGYLDPNGGAEDKASLGVTVERGGTYTVFLRLANGQENQPRPLTLKLGDQSVTIADTRTGEFTDWQDFPVTLRFEAGQNTLVVAQPGNAGSPNLDSVRIVPDQLDDPTAPNDGIETVEGVTFTVYEAEAAQLDGPVTDDDPRGQRGGEFVDFDGTTDQTITWTVSVPEDGTYAVDVLYALSTDKDARPLALAVDGVDQGTLPFAPNSTNAEDQWGPQSAVLTLAAGTHTIALTAPGANGPNLDYLRISQAPVDTFVPDYADIDGTGRIEREATDGTARVLGDDEVEFFFTVAADGAYALDLAADAGAPDGGGLTVLLDGQAIGTGAFPGTGEESTVFADLVAGTEYRLTVRSDAAGASSLDYLDLRPAPGNANADVAVQSLDPTFFDDRLHFSWIDDPSETDEGNPIADRDVKGEGTVRISNTGTEALDVLDAQIDGPFALTDPAALEGLTLQAGEGIDVEVTFDRDAFTPPTGGRNQRDAAQEVIEGALRIRTNDADSPVATVDLAAFWQPVPEGGWEPNVNEVWEMFGFGNRIEGLSNLRGGEDSTLSTNDVFASTDETEVLSPYWTLADGVSEARITQIAAFHGPGGATLDIHNPGNDGGGSNLIRFWTQQGTDNQRILPNEGSGFATELFDRGRIPDGWAGEDIFGVKVASLSTDPRLNPTGGVTVPGEQQGHTVKVFQALDAAGNEIADTYLIAMDYTGINYDYNDNLFVMEGVAPVGFGGVATISDLDDAAADDRLVFTNINNPDDSEGIQNFRDEATFTITNDGVGDLDVTGLVITGADAGSFEVVGAAPGTIAQGGSADVTVRFIGVDPANDNAAVLQGATLSVETSAGTDTVALAGLAQLQSEQGEEPSVAQIVEAFGYATDVAQGSLNNGGTVEAVGDEVLMPYLERLDGSQPVEVINLAAFLQQGNISRLNIHELADDDLTELFAGDDQQGQTVLPDGLVVGAGDTGEVGRASIDRDAPFGLKVTVDGRPTFAAWTDPEANVADPELGVNDGGHYIRFFQAKDGNGQAIEGTFIGIQDYPGGGNFDYNDAMFLVTNVQPHALTAEDDADADGVNDALETDADNDGLVAFFDEDDTPDQPAQQTAFNNAAEPWSVGGEGLTLMANLFDEGGQGVAYLDDGEKDGDASVRPDTTVDISNGTGAIGFTEAGEWVEYTISVPAAGEYELSFNSSSPTGGRTLTAAFEQDGVFYETVTADVPNTGAYTTYEDTAPVTATLQAGVQVIRVNFDLAQQDLMSFSLKPAAGNQPPVGADVADVAIDEGDAVSIDAGAAFTDADDDALAFAASGLPAGLAIDADTGVIVGTAPQVDADTDFEVTVTATDPGGASASETFTLSVSDQTVAPTGQQPFPGPDAPEVGQSLTLAATSYDEGGQGVAYLDAAGLQNAGASNSGGDGGRTGSDVEVTAGGDIGWIAPGEWLEYTIDVAEGGAHDLGLLLATAGGGRSVSVTFTLEGEATAYASTGAIANPSTGSYTTFVERDVQDLALQAGEQVVRVTFQGGGQDFRSLTLTRDEADPVNQAPVGGPLGDAQGTEGQAFSLDLSGAFTDPDGDALVFDASGLPTGLSISDAGVISGTPGADGAFAVSVTASDGELSDTESFTLTVAEAPAGPTQTPFPGPDAPVLGQSLTVDATDFDAGGQGVSWNDDPGRDGGASFRSGTDVELVGAELDVGYVEAGEWVEYTVDVAQAGTYALSLNAKTPIAGNGAVVSIEDGPALATFGLPDSNGASTGFDGTTFGQTAAQEIELGAGEQTLRFTFQGSAAPNGYLLDMRGFTLDAVDDQEPEVIGESGRVTFTQASADSWQTVTFAEALEDAAVVMGPLSQNGIEQGAMRVRNVTETGFEFQLDEWNYLDGGHIAETVSWLAVESGVHSLDGRTIAAGVGTASETKSTIAFDEAFGSAPVVLAQVTSTNDPDAVTDRISDVTATGFSVGLDDEEANAGVHGTESLAWIATEAGGSASSGVLTTLTADQVTQNPFTLGFQGSFADEFAFLADMQTEDGTDPATVRLQTLTASQASFFIEEEQSNDFETGHTTEVVGAVGLTTGVIFGDDVLA